MGALAFRASYGAPVRRGLTLPGKKQTDRGRARERGSPLWFDFLVNKAKDQSPLCREAMAIVRVRWCEVSILKREKTSNIPILLVAAQPTTVNKEKIY